MKLTHKETMQLLTAIAEARMLRKAVNLDTREYIDLEEKLILESYELSRKPETD